jgi:DNA-binding LacI/PurR family transcriptional regulator
LFNSVLTENIQGAYQAAEYLIVKGHREIGFIGGHERAFPSFVERRDGYRQALEDYGIHRQNFMDCSINRSEVAAVTMKLIKQNPKITAIVGVNDDTAITAMNTLIEAGYRIPQDISIIGFDDIYLAESIVPSLTTMRVNKQSMGRLGVQLLLNQVLQAESGLVTSLIRPVLIERNSVMAIS